MAESRPILSMTAKAYETVDEGVFVRAGERYGEEIKRLRAENKALHYTIDSLVRLIVEGKIRIEQGTLQ